MDREGVCRADACDPGAYRVRSPSRLAKYRGHDVIVVGKAALTFHRTFAHENCESDGRVRIGTERWLAIVALVGAEVEDENWKARQC